MILNPNHDKIMDKLIESYHELLTRIDDVQEELRLNGSDSPDMKGIKTSKLVQEWFLNDGTFPHKIKF